MDAVVCSWLFGTLNADLMESILVFTDTARLTWLCTEDMFRGNRETHALQLDAEFRLFEQGDLSIIDYYSAIWERSFMIARLCSMFCSA